MSELDFDYERAFGGVARLYGDAGASVIAGSTCAVVGVGGVGSWAAEALVRTAVGRIILIDLDNVAESNTNRQIQAMEGNYGKPKIEALAERFRRINPRCEIVLHEDFIDEENAGELLTSDIGVVLDCIDQVRAKAAMIASCVSRGIPVITSGAAGGRRDPTRIQMGDLAKISGDPLLSKVRHTLRKKYGFAPVSEKSGKGKFGVTAVYSDETVVRSQSTCNIQTDGGLACAGFGSSVCVTAPMGMTGASAAIEILLAKSLKK